MSGARTSEPPTPTNSDQKHLVYGEETAHKARSVLMQRLLRAFGPPLLFILLSAAFLWQPLATGRVFLPTDLSYKHDYVWRAHQDVPGASVAQNEMLSDVSDYYYPYTDYAISRLSAGQFPLWNPYILTGTPFFASTQPAVLDPINLLSYLAGPLDYWAWAAFLRLTLIGYAMYGFVRSLGRSIAGGVAAGTALMACGFVTVWLNYSVVSTFAWLPLMLWATTRMMQTGRVVWMAATAAAMGALLVAGHPETQFLSGLVWGLYGLFWVISGGPKSKVQSPNAELEREVAGKEPSAGRRLLMLAGASLLGVGLGAVQVLTFGEFLLGSSAIGERGGAAVPFDLGQMALRLAVTFFPNFGGNPTQENYWVPPFTNFNEQTDYLGLLTTSLAVLGVAVWARRDRHVLFFCRVRVVALLMEVRVPGNDWVRSLPIFNIGHGVRWAMVWSLCGAALSAYGVDAILAGSKFKVQSPKLFPVGGAVHTLTHHASRITPTAIHFRNVGLWFGGASAVALGFLLLMYLGLRDGYWDLAWQPIYSHEKVTRIFHPAQLTLYLPVLFLGVGALVLLAGWRGWLRRGGVVAMLILLLYSELWITGSRYNPVTPAQAVYPPTIVTDYLVQNLGHERIAGLENTLRPNVGMTFGLRDMRGYEDVVDQTHDSLYGSFGPALILTNEPDLRLTHDLQRLLNVAGVKYMLTLRKPRVDGDAKPYKSILQDDKVALYENLEVLPRAYVVYSSTVVASDFQAGTEALLAPANDPRLSVVLSGGGTALSGAGQNATTAPVTWLRDEPENVELAAELSAPGYLVLSDNYASGWEASVDGRPVPIVRANVTFRAVEVPQGSHTITFSYRPPLFYVGALVSGLSALIIFAIAVITLLTRRRVR